MNTDTTFLLDGGDDEDEDKQSENVQVPGDYSHDDELLGQVDKDDSGEQAL